MTFCKSEIIVLNDVVDAKFDDAHVVLALALKAVPEGALAATNAAARAGKTFETADAAYATARLSCRE